MATTPTPNTQRSVEEAGTKLRVAHKASLTKAWRIGTYIVSGVMLTIWILLFLGGWFVSRANHQGNTGNGRGNAPAEMPMAAEPANGVLGDMMIIVQPGTTSEPVEFGMAPQTICYSIPNYVRVEIKNADGQWVPQDPSIGGNAFRFQVPNNMGEATVIARRVAGPGC